MGAFIGPLGGLVELMHWQQSQSVDQGTGPSFFTAIDGSRTATVPSSAGRALREWSVSQDMSRPAEAVAFHSLCLGAYGPGPFLFVDPMAQWSNVLTPRQSLMDPVTLPSGVSPSRLAVPAVGVMPAVVQTAGGKIYGAGTPVLPGRPVTVAVFVAGTGSVRVTAQCKTVSGASTNDNSRAVVVNPAGMWLTTTVTPAADAARVEINVRSTATVTMACPSITWAPAAAPWSVGRGAREVVVSGFREVYGRMMAEQWQDVMEYQATVTEVGSGA